MHLLPRSIQYALLWRNLRNLFLVSFFLWSNVKETKKKLHYSLLTYSYVCTYFHVPYYTSFVVLRRSQDPICHTAFGARHEYQVASREGNHKIHRKLCVCVRVSSKFVFQTLNTYFRSQNPPQIECVCARSSKYVLKAWNTYVRSEIRISGLEYVFKVWNTYLRSEICFDEFQVASRDGNHKIHRKLNFVLKKMYLKSNILIYLKDQGINRLSRRLRFF